MNGCLIIVISFLCRRQFDSRYHGVALLKNPQYDLPSKDLGFNLGFSSEPASIKEFS